MARPVMPDTRTDCLTSTMSSQPQRRLRPVVAPNSWPTRWIRSPISSASSVTKGPLPTRVV